MDFAIRQGVSATGDGSKLEAEVAEPSGEGKAPALVVIQEYWGANDHVRSLVDRFAKEGFLAIAPDLYHGKVAERRTAGSALDRR